MAEHLLNGTELFAFTVDHEVSLISQSFDVLSQNAHAKGVKGTDGGPIGPRLRWPWPGPGQEFDYAPLHFTGGLIGKGDGQNIPRSNPLLDQMRDPVGDHA